MWCKNNGCCHYDKETNSCSRKREVKEEGICWMEKTEGEY